MLAGGCAGSLSSCSISTLAGKVSEHACWSLEALIKSRLYQKSPRNFHRAEETKSRQIEEALRRAFGTSGDAAFGEGHKKGAGEGLVLVKQPG